MIASNVHLSKFLIFSKGLAIGYSSMLGGTAIGEIQFADYIFPGKYRYTYFHFARKELVLVSLRHLARQQTHFFFVWIILVFDSSAFDQVRV